MFFAEMVFRPLHFVTDAESFVFRKGYNSQPHCAAPGRFLTGLPFPGTFRSRGTALSAVGPIKSGGADLDRSFEMM